MDKSWGGVELMTTKKEKKINEENLDPNLLSKVLGYKTVSQKDFVDQVNNRITTLENCKQEVSDMKNYFSKTEIVPKSNLDTGYVKQLDDHMAHKIEYADLSTSLSNRIECYENDAQQSISDTKNMMLKLNAVSNSLNVAKSDITNIYTQLSSLQTFPGNSGSSGGSSDSSSNAQINSILSQITDINNEINNINASLADTVSQSSVQALQVQVNNIDKKIDSVNTDPPNGIQGESIVLGDGKFAVSRMLLAGKPINIDSITTTCEAEINKNDSTSYFDFGNNVAYVLKDNNGLTYYEQWMDSAVTSTYTKGNATYSVINNAFTSWFGNNKFIIDYSTGIFGVSLDGEYTEICRSTTTASIENINNDIDNIRIKINDLETLTNNMNTTINNLDARLSALEAVTPIIPK